MHIGFAFHNEESLVPHKLGGHGVFVGHGCAIGSGCGQGGSGGGSGGGAGFGSAGGYFCGGRSARRGENTDVTGSAANPTPAQNTHTPTVEEVSQGLCDMWAGSDHGAAVAPAHANASLPTAQQIGQGLSQMWAGSGVVRPKQGRPVHLADARSCANEIAGRVIRDGVASGLAGFGLGLKACKYAGPLASECQTAATLGGITHGVVKGVKEGLESPACDSSVKENVRDLSRSSSHEAFADTVEV